MSEERARGFRMLVPQAAWHIEAAGVALYSLLTGSSAKLPQIS
jgi:hypothetical protein